jgi:hypothetical protein
MLLRLSPRNVLRAVLLCLWLLALLPVARTSANGVPVTLILSYVDGVSTWGPRNATGISEFVARESELRLTTTGLPRLEGEEYRVWVTNTNTGQRLALTSFNAEADGTVDLDVVLDMVIPDGGWNLMFLSVEAAGSQAAEPGPRRALAGRWPVPGTGQGDARPAELPRTGGVIADDPFHLAALQPILIIGAVGLALLVGVRLGRQTARGRAQ